MADLPHITIEVLPVTSGLHACMSGPVVLMSIPGRGEIAYCEAMGEGHVIFDDQAILAVECRYDLLRGDALTPHHSAQFLRDLLEKL